MANYDCHIFQTMPKENKIIKNWYYFNYVIRKRLVVSWHDAYTILPQFQSGVSISYHKPATTTAATTPF